ncbi:outer membrane beta-barrel protein [Maribacter sp. SA7]|uniref:outer membrane beta-barrel protein n=1 Tax=Maribacter zhoushanensis TaxID=3030012 RepID=UPI0023EE05FF|nr:outer membrane beta-barrel protein [Maribacter zhoushanensis]MDF4204975.1 outer membrane beta-barrel protein [Maribacter zhoushanensis]
MKEIILLLSLFIFFLSAKLNAQQSNTSYGIQAGMNYSRYTPRFPEPEVEGFRYAGIIGFYAGGFVNFEINEKLKIQPSLIFAFQGSKFIFENIKYRNVDFNFSAKVVESTIIIPVAVQNYLSKKFYIEAGPQIGYTISTRGTFDDGTASETIMNNDKLDFGFFAGMGYQLNKYFTLNSKYLIGIIKRRDIKTAVLNIGIEYRF